MYKGLEIILIMHDLLGRNNVSNITDISLQLYKNFFDNVLCKRIFLYSLDDGNKLKLIFDTTNFMHILGAQHILGIRYKATRFNNEVTAGTMNFQELEKKNSIVFNDFTDRFLNFSNLYHVITNCTVIYFNKEIYEKNRNSDEESLMDFTYILYEDLNNKKIHLGIDTFNKGHSYYGKSLLVKSINNDAFIKGQKPIEIKNIKVIDKVTKQLIEDKNVGQADDDSQAKAQ